MKDRRFQQEPPSWKPIGLAAHSKKKPCLQRWSTKDDSQQGIQWRSIMHVLQQNAKASYVATAGYMTEGQLSPFHMTLQHATWTEQSTIECQKRNLFCLVTHCCCSQLHFQLHALQPASTVSLLPVQPLFSSPVAATAVELCLCQESSFSHSVSVLQAALFGILPSPPNSAYNFRTFVSDPKQIASGFSVISHELSHVWQKI